jgi:hypothetical protein
LHLPAVSLTSNSTAFRSQGPYHWPYHCQWHWHRRHQREQQSTHCQFVMNLLYYVPSSDHGCHFIIVTRTWLVRSRLDSRLMAEVKFVVHSMNPRVILQHRSPLLMLLLPLYYYYYYYYYYHR